MTRSDSKDNFDNPVTEVPLRHRSTPYEFEVSITRNGKPLRVYTGKSHNYAGSAYWQAVNTARFFGDSATIKMEITKSRKQFGGFNTEIKAGKPTSLHKASGNCREWITSQWLESEVAEKLIATVPGTLGPSKDQL